MRHHFTKAVKDSIATFFAYFPLGIVFGILFTSELPYHWLFAPLMSLLVFAGAVQFVALGVISTNGSLISLFITVFMIALRNSFYGLSLLHRYDTRFWRKQYLIFGLVDATYSIIQHKGKRQGEEPYLLSLTALIHFYWVSGTFIGAYFGTQVVNIPGLEFCLTALFTVFFIEQWKKSKDLMIVIVALLAFGFGLIFLKGQAFIMGILITLFYLCLRYLIKERKS